MSHVLDWRNSSVEWAMTMIRTEHTHLDILKVEVFTIVPCSYNQKFISFWSEHNSCKCIFVNTCVVFKLICNFFRWIIWYHQKTVVCDGCYAHSLLMCYNADDWGNWDRMLNSLCAPKFYLDAKVCKWGWRLLRRNLLKTDKTWERIRSSVSNHLHYNCKRHWI